MNSLKDIVRRRTLIAGVVPLLLLAVATTGILLKYGLQDARQESRLRATQSAVALDQASKLLGDHLRTMIDGSLAMRKTASVEALERWIDKDSAICLMSIWKGDSMLFSHPRKDVARMLSGSEREWSQVVNDPRCEEPVVRRSFELGSDSVAEVALRLSYVSKALLNPLRYPGAELSLVDERGVYVANFKADLLGQKEVDPLYDRFRGMEGNDASGSALESGRAVNFWARRLDGPPWTMIARQDLFEAIRPLLWILAFVVVFLAISFALAVGLARDAVGRILKPLYGLRESLVSVEKGEEVGRVPRADVVELDALVETFERMARSIEAREAERRTELENAVAELEAFSYSVSHDLRAPLRSIAGYSQVLEEDAAHRLLPQDVDALVRIRRATGRMSELIEDLLALSKASRAPLLRHRVDMGALVREVADALAAAEPSRRVELDIGELGFASADEGLIRQVWVNLLSNAFKFTSRRDDARVVLRAEHGNGWTTWTVSDNGVGFNEEHASKLFQPFRRMHGEAEFPGTGIGLALVKRIMDRHGGTIHASSSEGGGAKFSFALPDPER